MNLHQGYHVIVLWICLSSSIVKVVVVEGSCEPPVPRSTQNVQVTCTSINPEGCNTPGARIANGTRAEVKCFDNYETNYGTNGIKILTCDSVRWVGQALFEEIQCKIKCGRPAIKDWSGLPMSEAARLRWPWHVAIYHNDSYVCGGSIINPIGQELFILTTLRCVTMPPDGALIDMSSLKIITGAISSDLRENMRTPNTQILGVKQIKFSQDVALIQTNKPIRMNFYTLPVCLPSTEILVNDLPSSGTVPGFGNPSEKFHVVTLPVISSDACTDFLGHRPNASQICAGMPNEANACMGDMGGGLVFRQEHPIRYMLQGILHTHENPNPCQGIKVFTKVSNFLEWIELESDKIFYADTQDAAIGKMSTKKSGKRRQCKYLIKKDIAPGKDISVHPGMPFVQYCCNQCLVDPKCKGFAHTGWDCWTKYEFDPMIDQPDDGRQFISGIIEETTMNTNEDKTCKSTGVGTDISPGIDLAFIDASSWEDCCEKCKVTTACAAFVFKNPHCWLKLLSEPIKLAPGQSRDQYEGGIIEIQNV